MTEGRAAQPVPPPWYVRLHLLFRANHALIDSYYHPSSGATGTWVFKCDCGRVWIP